MDGTGEVYDELSIVQHSCSSGDPRYMGLEDNITVHILDADASVVLSQTTASLQEGRQQVYSVSLASQPTSAVTITVSGNNSDIDIMPQLLIFNATTWNIVQNVTIVAEMDGLGELSNEVFSVWHTVLSNDTRYNGVVVTNMTVGIEDVDVGLEIDAVSPVALTEGGNFTYGVRLRSQPIAAVVIFVVNNNTSNAGDVKIFASNLTFTSSNWQVVQNVSIFAVADGIGEQFSELVGIKHLCNSTDTRYDGLVQFVDIDVTDADRGVLIYPMTLNVSEGGASVSYIVRLKSQPSCIVNITFAVGRKNLPSWQGTDGNIFPPTGQKFLDVFPSHLTFSTDGWAQGQNVTLTAVEDQIDLGVFNEFIITHSTSSSDDRYNGSAVNTNVLIEGNDAGGIDVNGPSPAYVIEGSSPAFYDGATRLPELQIEVQLRSQPFSGVIISAAGDITTLTSQSATLAAAAQLHFNSSNWNISQNMTLSAVDDITAGCTKYQQIAVFAGSSTDSVYNTSVSHLPVYVLDNEQELAGKSAIHLHETVFLSYLRLGQKQYQNAPVG